MSTVEEKDLTVEDGTLEPTTYGQLVSQGPVVEPFNIDKEQEKIRGLIAQALVVLLAILVLFAFITLWVFSSAFADLEKLMTIVFGPVIALVGTAIGYYFGGKNTSGGLSGGGK
ncbi:MAG: hypothetical protein ACT4PG_09150 [Panacagrimonas sp.]